MHDSTVYDYSIPSHICNEELGEDRVRDYCRLSGKFREAAVEYFNKVPTFFPVVFHNLSGYNSNLFIKTLRNSEGDISCIPNNEVNHISFTKQVIIDKFVNTEGKKVSGKTRVKIYRPLVIYGFES